MRRIRVDRDEAGEARLYEETSKLEPVAPGQVRLAVKWSALNYKDALAASANPGVARRLPLTPGIDAAGVVLESDSPDFPVGQPVLATGHDFGVAHDGGWQQVLDAPVEWLVALPNGLTLRNAMVLGTAGFTAMQCLEEIQGRGIHPDDGAVLVTGATGGVGCIAVALLAHAGYAVTAATGKQDKHEWLQKLGAASCISREEAAPPSDAPMLPGRWAAAVDTVGGATLTAVVKSLRQGGAVAACGVVAGPQLDLTVYPFILRGVSLLGVDSAWHPMPERVTLWGRLSQAFQASQFDELIDSEMTLDALPEAVARILAGGVCGRVIVRVGD